MTIYAKIALGFGAVLSAAFVPAAAITTPARAGDAPVDAASLVDPTGWQLAVEQGDPAAAAAHYDDALALYASLDQGQQRAIEDFGLTPPPGYPEPEAITPESLETLERAADALLEGARHVKAVWPPWPFPDDANDPAPQLWPYADILLALQTRRIFSRGVTGFASLLAAEGRHEESARLLMAFNDYARASERRDFLAGDLLDIALAHIADQRLARLAPEFPEDIRAKASVELDRRIARGLARDTAAPLEDEVRIQRRCIQLLREAPNREALADEIREYLDSFKPKPPRPNPASWSDRLGAMIGSWFEPGPPTRKEIIGAMETEIAWAEELIAALREGRDAAPILAAAEADAQKMAFQYPGFALSPAYARYPEMARRANMSFLLLRAGYACLAEPDRDRWPALPEMRHPDTGLPFVAAAYPEGQTERTDYFILYETPEAAHDWRKADKMPPMRFGPPAGP